MCGIIGMYQHDTNQDTCEIAYQICEGLIALQHRGQDSAGIANMNMIYCDYGLVKNIFSNKNLDPLVGNRLDMSVTRQMEEAIMCSRSVMTSRCV